MLNKLVLIILSSQIIDIIFSQNTSSISNGCVYNSNKLSYECKISFSSDFSNKNQVELLILRNISLESIPDKICDFKSLKTLDLSGNKINRLNNLSCLKNLVNLDLSNNKLNRIYKGDLNGLVKLETLDLTANALIELDEESFSKLSNIMWLSLSNNNLTSIKKNTFSELKQLEYLDLSRNSISSIANETFKKLSIFIKLFLGFNNLTDINGIDFDNLYNLHELNMFFYNSDLENLLRFPVYGPNSSNYLFSEFGKHF